MFHLLFVSDMIRLNGWCLLHSIPRKEKKKKDFSSTKIPISSIKSFEL